MIKPTYLLSRGKHLFGTVDGLLELIAPPSVEFFCLNRKRLGDKKSLEQQLHKITGIPVSALRNTPLSNFSFDERVLWARNRDTKREEDLAYSLLGIFDISIPVIYGEGRENAFRRLNREWKYRLDELLQATSNYATRLTILQQTLKGHSNNVTSVAFSPDSRLLASASRYVVHCILSVPFPLSSGNSGRPDQKNLAAVAIGWVCSNVLGSLVTDRAE
jgi:WD40 repeat protein